MSVQSRLENNEKPTFLFKLTTATDLSTASWSLNSGNVYKTTLSNNNIYSTCDYVSGTTINTLTEKTSVGALVQGSAFLDRDTSILYVWLTDDTDPSTKDVILKQFRFYATNTINVNHDLTDGTTKHITWDGLVSFKSFKQNIDFISDNFKAYRFEGISINIQEQIPNIVSNQDIECHLGFNGEDASTFVQVFKGRVASYDKKDNSTRLKLTTSIQSMLRRLPLIRLSDLGERPNSEQENHFIPFIYGKVSGVKCYNIDGFEKFGRIPVGTNVIINGTGVFSGTATTFRAKMRRGDTMALTKSGTTETGILENAIDNTTTIFQHQNWTVSQTYPMNTDDDNKVRHFPHDTKRTDYNRKWVVCNHKTASGSITNVKYGNIEFDSSDYTINNNETINGHVVTTITFDEDAEFNHITSQKNAAYTIQTKPSGSSLQRIDGNTGATFTDDLEQGFLIWVGVANTTSGWAIVNRINSDTNIGVVEDMSVNNTENMEFKSNQNVIDGGKFKDVFVTCDVEGRLDSGNAFSEHPADLALLVISDLGGDADTSSFTDLETNLTSSDFDSGFVIPQKQTNNIVDVPTGEDILNMIGKSCQINFIGEFDKVKALGLNNKESRSVKTIVDADIINQTNNYRLDPKARIKVSYNNQQSVADEENIWDEIDTELTKFKALYGTLKDDDNESIINNETDATTWKDFREDFVSKESIFKITTMSMNFITDIEVGDVIKHETTYYLIVSSQINSDNLPVFTWWDLADTFV